MQLGKFSSDRDNVLHFLCLADWSNESFGNVEAPTGYVWRISNTANDVSLANTEFTSVIEEWNQSEFNTDSLEFRNSLVGHFLLQEDSNGLVHVHKFETEETLLKHFQVLETEFSDWDSQEEE